VIDSFFGRRFKQKQHVEEKEQMLHASICMECMMQASKSFDLSIDVFVLLPFRLQNVLFDPNPSTTSDPIKSEGFSFHRQE
jgi:hypothetical protein